MSPEEIRRRAGMLEEAARQGREIERFTASDPAFSMPDAYLVQEELVSHAVASGDKRIGWKMGLTSRAKMQQMKVNQPIYGILTERQRLQSGDELSLKSRIHAKIEPEVAFVMKSDLSGRVDLAAARAACAGACAAMEVIDSRYRNFEFQLPDVVADNCSASAFVLGPIAPLPQALATAAMEMRVDGSPVQKGSAADILGDPLLSLIELSVMLEARGLSLHAGDVVLAGAATAAVMLKAGTRVEATVAGLPPVSLRVS